MERKFKAFTTNDYIAFTLENPSRSILAFRDGSLKINSEGEISGKASVLPTSAVKLLAEKDLRALPFPVYMIETIHGTLLGIFMLIIGLLNRDYRMTTLGALFILPYFKTTKRFVSELINGSTGFRKHFTKKRQHTAAANMVLNAFAELGRVPTLEEAKKYKMTDYYEQPTTDSYIGFTYLTLIIAVFFSSIEVLSSGYFILGVGIFFFVVYLTMSLGLFNFVEKNGLEKPEDEDIALAIFALSMGQTSDSFMKSFEDFLNEHGDDIFKRK